jgi:TonB family protein
MSCCKIRELAPIAPSLSGAKLRGHAVAIALALAVTVQGAPEKAGDRLRVFVDASLVQGLVSAPVPNYPVAALKEKWGGFGVFELQFRPNGTVKNVVTLLTTGYQLLDETARAALWQWRSSPAAQNSARLTMRFSTHHRPVTIQPGSVEAISNFPVHPTPRYPAEAQRHGWQGTGLFVLRFREDGSMEKVVTLRSTGHPALDDEGVRTLLRWHCRPGLYMTAYIPITFAMRG